MPTYFVTRHPGAHDWARRHDIAVDHVVAHLDPGGITAGDHVLGSLPVHLAAQVCARGGHYHHLVLDLPPELRGRELSADDMDAAGAHLAEYRVTPVHEPQPEQPA